MFFTSFITLFCYNIQKNYVAYHYLKSGDLKLHKLIEPVDYLIHIMFIKNNSLVIVSIFFYMAFVAQIFHYDFFEIVKFFPEYYEDLINFCKVLRVYKYNFGERLYMIYKNEHYQIEKVIADRIYFRANPYAQNSDKLKFLKFFHKVDIFFFLNFIGGIMCLSIVFISSCYIFTIYTPALNIFDLALSYTKIFLYVFSFIIALWGGWFPICFVGIFIYLLSTVRNRFFKYFFPNLNERLLEAVENQEKMELFHKQIRFGRRIFVHSIKESDNINRNAFAKAYFRSAITLTVSHIISIVIVMISKHTVHMKLFLLAVIFINCLSMLGTAYLGFKSTKNIYSHSLSYNHICVFLSQHYMKTFTLPCLRLSHFIEMVHNKKQFAFSVGPLGKVTPRAICAFVPVYVSLVLNLIPLLRNKM